MFQAAPAANVSAPPLNSGGFDKYSWVPRENKNSLQTSNKLREYFHWIRSECCPLGYGGLVGWWWTVLLVLVVVSVYSE